MVILVIEDCFFLRFVVFACFFRFFHVTETHGHRGGLGCHYANISRVICQIRVISVISDCFSRIVMFDTSGFFGVNKEKRRGQG